MMLLLSGCATGLFERPGTVIVKHVCLHNVEYDKATQDKAGAELAALPKDAALRRFVGDYVQQRDKVRECIKRAQEVK